LLDANIILINCFSINFTILVDQNISINNQDDAGDVFDKIVKEMISPTCCCHLAIRKKIMRI